MAGFKLGLLPFLSGLILCAVPKKLVGKICSRDNNDVERILCEGPKLSYEQLHCRIWLLLGLHVMRCKTT